MVWKRLYKDGAYDSAGTLAQLQSLINRTNVTKKTFKGMSMQYSTGSINFTSYLS